MVSQQPAGGSKQLSDDRGGVSGLRSEDTTERAVSYAGAELVARCRWKSGRGQERRVRLGTGGKAGCTSTGLGGCVVERDIAILYFEVIEVAVGRCSAAI